VVWLSVLGLVFLLLVSTNAHAGTLTSATWFQVTNARPGFLPGIPMTRTTLQLGATGTSTASSVAVGLSYPFFATTFTVPATPDSVLENFTIRLTQGGPHAIAATANLASGMPGIPGQVTVSGAAHVQQSMTTVFTVVRVPLSHGQAGQFTSTFSVLGVFHNMTVDFYAWTPGTVVFTGLTSVYDPLPDVTAMGSFALTAKGGGTVTLVSPARVHIDGTLAQIRSVSVTSLVLTFVPEPSTLLLLGGAALALPLLARRAGARGRKNEPAPSRESAGPGR